MVDLISRDAAIAAIEQARNAFALPDDFPGSRMVNAGFAAARGALEKVPSAAGWVSVNDRLPEHFTRVLVFRARKHSLNTGGIFTAWLVQHPDMFRNHEVWVLAGTRNDCISGVTHWMELPAPPSD